MASAFRGYATLCSTASNAIAKFPRVFRSYRIHMTTLPLKLDLACGIAKQPGWFGVDVAEGTQADLVFDLTTTPWPWADGSVAEVRCSHFFEHLGAEQRVRFMEEVWRILVPGGKATITVPHARSDGAVQDPTHQWPPIVESRWYAAVWRATPTASAASSRPTGWSAAATIS